MSAGRAVGACFVGVLIGGSLALAVAPGAPPHASPDLPPKPSADGAVTSAIAYLEALSLDVLLDDDQRREAIERRALPEAVDALDARLDEPVERLRAVAEAPVVARRAILGYRIENYSGPDATVAVWGMALFATGVYDAATQWSTSRINLRWRTNRWLVASVENDGGPSPQSALDDLTEIHTRFREVRHVP